MNSKRIKKGFRHGDVLVIRTHRIPKTAKLLNHLVLAEGEVTGHAHVVHGDASLYEMNGLLYLKVHNDEAFLKHEEHDPINLPKGSYLIRKQREYDPQKLVKEVVD